MAARRAIPIIQDIYPRSSFNGGWPLALPGTGSGCPSFAPVVCKEISDTNPQCCPSGLSCNGDSITTYCCPSSESRKINQLWKDKTLILLDADCGSYVK